jgi:hypothetical protein
MVADEKTRVDFNAPSELVKQADVIANLLDTSRTQLLIEALRGEIASLTTDEEFRRRVKQAYYSGRIDVDVLESVLGSEEASRTRLLAEAVTRDPPAPRRDIEPVPESAFYDGPVPSWDPPEEDDEGVDEPAPTSDP